jgi:hypothetical protein
MKIDPTESLQERAFYAEKAVPKLYKSSFALEPAMLKSALFRPAAGTRAVFEQYTEVAVHGSHGMEYRGEELRQDDERVLMALLKLRAGELVTAEARFVPRKFCREVLEWADSSDSVAKLKASIKRLHDARVRITYADGGENLYSFVSDAELHGDEWKVWLSPRLAQMFERSCTYVDMKTRLSLKDGLASWLYGFIKADVRLGRAEALGRGQRLRAERLEPRSQAGAGEASRARRHPRLRDEGRQADHPQVVAGTLGTKEARRCAGFVMPGTGALYPRAGQ